MEEQRQQVRQSGYFFRMILNKIDIEDKYDGLGKMAADHAVFGAIQAKNTLI